MQDPKDSVHARIKQQKCVGGPELGLQVATQTLHGNEHRSNSNCQINMPFWSINVYHHCLSPLCCIKKGAKRGTGATHITHTNTHTHTSIFRCSCAMSMPSTQSQPVAVPLHPIGSRYIYPILSLLTFMSTYNRMQRGQVRCSIVQHNMGRVCMFLIHLTWNTIPMNPTMSMINVI